MKELKLVGVSKGVDEIINESMHENGMVKGVFDSELIGVIRVDRPHKRWMDRAIENLWDSGVAVEQVEQILYDKTA